MKLHWSPRSPFVRKVMIVLHETGQVDDVDYVRTVVTSTTPPNPDLLPDNPLCQIPTLVLDDGSALFDSRVICEYFDARAGHPGLFPVADSSRYRHLRWQCVGDGFIHLLLLYRNESLRDQGGSSVLLSTYQAKLKAVMSSIEAETNELDETNFGIGHISLACALGQLDFRYGHTGWRDHFPGVAAWYESLRTRASIAATEVVDDSAATLGSQPFADAKVALEW